jgi:hypothetical protein
VSLCPFHFVLDSCAAHISAQDTQFLSHTISPTTTTAIDQNLHEGSQQ